MSPSHALHLVDRPDQAARLLKPVRLQILKCLATGDSAAGVARRLSLPRQKVNYHLRQLEQAGLLELVEERRRGNCTERVLRARATRWVVDPAVFGGAPPDAEGVVDQFSSSHLASLAAQAVREIAELRRRADAEGKRVGTLSMQSEVRFASAESRKAFTEELGRVFARLVSRYHDAGASGGRTFRFAALAWPKPSPPKEDR